MADKLIIAIDYDDTFTADTDSWARVIELLQSFGHRVICVSARHETYGNRRELETAMPEGVKVFLSYGFQKRTFMQQHGIDVDIWIDDLPESVPSKKDMLIMCG